MKRPQPRNEEAHFTVDELFFSKTDQRGVILAGNSVFFRVSGYSADEMIGEPHNIIRHPDMPKAVFKYFWERLKSDEPIVAYVKNLSSDGKYYWVLASAVPVKDGYVSIRLKPTSPILKTVEALYAQVLDVERREGVEKAYDFLFAKIQELGFANYIQFSQQALAQEFASRSAQLANFARMSEAKHLTVQAAGSPSERRLVHLLEYLSQNCAAALDLYADINQRLTNLGQSKLRLEEGSRDIRVAYETVKYLPLNMAVESERAGAEGAILAVVSETFKNWFQEATNSLGIFFESFDFISDRLEGASYSVAVSQTQVELLRFLVHEIRGSITNGVIRDTPDFDRAYEEIAGFVQIAHSVLEPVHRQLAELLDVSNKVSASEGALRDAVRALSVIRQSGRVETERLSGPKGAFHAHLVNMAAFLELVDNKLKGIEKDTKDTLTDVIAVQAALSLMLENCSEERFSQISAVAAAE